MKQVDITVNRTKENASFENCCDTLLLTIILVEFMLPVEKQI